MLTQTWSPCGQRQVYVWTDEAAGPPERSPRRWAYFQSRRINAQASVQACATALDVDASTWTQRTLTPPSNATITSTTTDREAWAATLAERAQTWSCPPLHEATHR